MQVKVKKSILFNLLKDKLNENRTNDNPGGNFINPFDRGVPPIEASSHMAMQLSEEEPPVADENYVPASIRELRSAASRIAEEVPPEQIEYYYRALHRLLDNAIDKSNSDEPQLNEGVINLLSESMDFYNKKIDQLAAIYREDPYFDIDEAVDEIMNNADVYGLDPSLADPIEIQNDIIQKAEASLGDEPGSIATAPTPKSASPSQTSRSQTPDDDDETDEDLPELTDDEADRMLGSLESDDIDREMPTNKPHKALTQKYWSAKIEEMSVEDGDFPLSIVSQVVIDSMDAVSRLIGTQVAVSQYGYGGAGTDQDARGGEASSWKGILSNDVNTNSEVVYRLPAKRKTKEFWQPRVTKFISKLQSGSAGSLSEFSESFNKIAVEAFEKYTQASGLNVTKFLGQIVSRVTESILFDPSYGALTRNVAVDEEQLLSKLIDTGFSSQTKKEPFNIPTKATFKARRLDPAEVIEHAGQEKTLRQAIIDAVVAYAIVKSDEFKTQRRALDADLDDETKDAAIQDIIKSLSDSKMLTYTAGRGAAKSSYEVSKSDIIPQVEAYVDSKFEEANVAIPEGEELTDDEMARYLEDETVPEADKKVAFTDEIAAQIMGTESSAASFRDYDYRVLSRKQKLAFTALQDDRGNSEDVNYVNVYNDIISELAPTAEAGIKDIKSTGMTSEEIDQIQKYVPYYNAAQVKDLTADIVSAAASDEVGIPAVTRIVYGMPEKIEYEGQSGEIERDATRGGETFLQNVSSEDLDFLTDSGAAGPSIIRNVVGSIMGKSLRGGGLKKIADIDFNKANEAVATKVVRSAVEVEKSLIKMFTSEFQGIDLKKAQESAYTTAVELGIKESKAKFLEKNMQELQIKTIYPFVGRVKRLPDFNKMNPAAKNYVCWLAAIANKRHDDAPTEQERIETAREIFDKLKKAGDDMLDGKRTEVKELTDKVDNAVDVALSSEIQGIKTYSDDMVKKLSSDDKLLRDVLVQSIAMHLQDVSR